jgi:hypothetical protein
VLSDEFLPGGSLLYFGLEEVAHLGPLQLHALARERRRRTGGCSSITVIS